MERRDQQGDVDRRSWAGGVAVRGDDGRSPVLEGHAAVFYREGDPGTEYDMREAWGFVERIMPGAFDQALAEVRAGEVDVLGLFNHDWDQLLGRTRSGTVRLSVDERGLAYEIDLGDTTAGRDIAEHVRRGDVWGSSFAFRATDECWVEDPDGHEVREVRAVRLFDVSPVTFPAYRKSDVGLRVVGQRFLASGRRLTRGAVVSQVGVLSARLRLQA